MKLADFCFRYNCKQTMSENTRKTPMEEQLLWTLTEGKLLWTLKDGQLLWKLKDEQLLWTLKEGQLLRAPKKGQLLRAPKEEQLQWTPEVLTSPLAWFQRFILPRIYIVENINCEMFPKDHYILEFSLRTTVFWPKDDTVTLEYFWGGKLKEPCDGVELTLEVSSS